MLRSFQVTNHKSLAHTQQLRLNKGTGPVAVPVTEINGAPAAGKSALLDALAQMRAAVLDSVTGWDPYAGPVRTPHLDFPERPTEFVASFVAEGVPYTYGFQLDSADVVAEWLHTHPRARKRIVFERHGEQVKIGQAFEAVRFGIGALVPLVRPNALLLSLAGQLYSEALVPAYRWFQTMLEVQFGPTDVRAVEHRLGNYLSRSPERAARLLTLLRSADLGITDLLLAEPDPRYADYLRELDAEIAGIGTQLERCATSVDFADRLFAEHEVTPIVLERELTNMVSARAALYERMVDRSGVGLGLVHDGVRTPFDITDESTTTVAVLRLLPVLLDALDTGRVLAVDDLGAQLPSEETDRLIQLFHNPETNSRGAQLIYTFADGDGAARAGRANGSARATTWRVERTEDGMSELTPM